MSLTITLNLTSNTYLDGVFNNENHSHIFYEKIEITKLFAHEGNERDEVMITLVTPDEFEGSGLCDIILTTSQCEVFITALKSALFYQEEKEGQP